MVNYKYGLLTKREVKMVKFCLRDTAGSPERARWLHLARSGSQSQRAIWFILPAHGASHIIKYISIYTLSDLGVLSNLIGSLSLANEH